MARTKLSVGMMVRQKPQSKPYWADGLIEGEIIEMHAGRDDVVRVRVNKTSNPRGLHTIGCTLWMEANCLIPIVSSKPCRLTFVW